MSRREHGATLLHIAADVAVLRYEAGHDRLR
jgi:hypothetical protein